MIDGTYILEAAAALLALLIVSLYVTWARWDERRRQQRRIHLNLQRMAGR